MDTQITRVTQKCDIKCDEANGYKYVAWDPSSSDPNLHNAHCANKEQKTCTVKINEVSCRYNEEKDDAERYINYTYGSSCPSQDHIIIWDYLKDFSSHEGGAFNEPGSNSRISYSSDWSITRTTLLNPPSWIRWGPTQFYIKVILWEWGYDGRKYSWKQIGSLWQENWQVFTVERVDIANKNKCYFNKYRPEPEAPHRRSQKIDWKGNPFEWKQYMIYAQWPNGKPQELALLESIRQPGVNRIDEDNRAYGMVAWSYIHSSFSYPGNIPTLYMPYSMNQWIAFKIEQTWKIIEAHYVGSLEG